MKFLNNPYKALTRMVGLNMVFGVIAIATWYFIPSTRMTLHFDVWVAIVDAAISSALFAVALFGIIKKQKWGAILACAVTLAQRILGGFMFDFNVGMGLTFVWTVLMVNFSYMELKQPKF